MSRPKHFTPSAIIEHSREGLHEVPPEQWRSQPRALPNMTRVFKSRAFFVQEFTEASGVIRLSVNRVKYNAGRAGFLSWYTGVSWDDLQWLKQELGYGARCGVELYPPEADVVNVANIRHLWILPAPPEFMWRNDDQPVRTTCET
jgi:hypothetical protein